MDINKIDLNLLTAFCILMEEKSVTRAANRLCVSQSAMSHTLRRLRNLFDDPVLVPSPSGMQPTPRAVQLFGPVKEALKLLEKSLGTPPDFDPGTSGMSFVLGSSDYLEYVLVPPLIKHLAEVAPQVTIQMRHYRQEEMEDLLEKGELNIVIRPRKAHSAWLNSSHLFSEIPVVLARVNHPQIGETMDRQLYLSLKHVVIKSISLGDKLVCDTWQIDDSLRTVTLRTPGFRSAPMILADTDLITTLPQKIAHSFVGGGRLKIVSFPEEIKPFSMQMVWHKVLDNDAPQVWFREQLRTVAEKLEEREPELI